MSTDLRKNKVIGLLRPAATLLFMPGGPVDRKLRKKGGEEKSGKPLLLASGAAALGLLTAAAFVVLKKTRKGKKEQSDDSLVSTAETEEKPKKRLRLLLIIGLVMLLAGLAWTGYNIWDNKRAGEAATAALEELSVKNAVAPGMYIETERAEAEPVPETPAPEYVANPEKEMPVETVNDIDYIGKITLPTLELELPVISDWDYTRLGTAPCRYEGSAYTGNFVICAHNYDTHFGLLDTMSVGDPVQFTDVEGNVFDYTVTGFEEVGGFEVDYVVDETACDLTLFTCVPGGYMRFITRCDKTQ